MIIWNDEENIVETPQPVKADSGNTPKLTVESINNHVYFYAMVDSDRCLALMKSIREIDDQLRNEYFSRELPEDHPYTPIWLHVQSPGGALFAGLSVGDQLKKIKSPIYSIVEGYVASAATLISMSCTKRFIQPSAFMLIHQLSALTWGTYEQLRDDMHLYDMAMQKLVNFYSSHSKLKEDDVKELLKRDSWFNADECYSNGFIDEVA